MKVITGDNELVTRNICERVGIDVEQLVLGSEIDHIDDLALAQIAEQTEVFARVSPAHKNRIIMALKSRSHVVGFLGDGINDAPSLHSADVGISVANAVDVLPGRCRDNPSAAGSGCASTAELSRAARPSET